MFYDLSLYGFDRAVQIRLQVSAVSLRQKNPPLPSSIILAEDFEAGL